VGSGVNSAHTPCVCYIRPGTHNAQGLRDYPPEAVAQVLRHPDDEVIGTHFARVFEALRCDALRIAACHLQPNSAAHTAITRHSGNALPFLLEILLATSIRLFRQAVSSERSGGLLLWPECLCPCKVNGNAGCNAKQYQLDPPKRHGKPCRVANR
jgi:hypothetical protein